MNSDKAVKTLLAIQHFIQAIEAILIDTVSMIIPWVSPLLSAFLAWQAMTEKLRFPAWLALAGSAVVELLGLATINTVFVFWQFNKTARKSDPRSPIALAMLVSAFYLIVVLTVNTMLDSDPVVFKLAKALLSSLSIVGGVTIALRASHNKRLADIRVDRMERKEERQIRREEATSGNILATSSEPAQELLRRDWRLLSFAERTRIKEMSSSEIAALYNIPDRTARQWKQTAQKNGHKETYDNNGKD